MVYPLNNDKDPYHPFTYYQGVITSELVSMFGLFIVLHMIHYTLWGHDEQIYLQKKREEAETEVKPPQSSQWKWNQKNWDIYFPIIFANHIIAVFLPMTYLPNIFTCVIAYCHFACFLGMLINEIFISQKKKGEGGKTITNRIFWILMCLFNLVLIVAGISGVRDVIA